MPSVAVIEHDEFSLLSGYVPTIGLEIRTPVFKLLLIVVRFLGLIAYPLPQTNPSTMEGGDTSSRVKIITYLTLGGVYFALVLEHFCLGFLSWA